MTEIEAQKFIARWTPGGHSCEATRARISRIRLQFGVCIAVGAMVFFGSLMKRLNLEFSWLIRWAGIVYGLALMSFGWVMLRRLKQVGRVLYPPFGPVSSRKARVFRSRPPGRRRSRVRQGETVDETETMNING